MRAFLADLRSILGPGVLKRVGRKVWEDDCPGLVGQLAYFLLLSLFPGLIFLVSLAGLVMDDPESALGTLTARLGGLLPEDAVRLLADYIDRTLRGAGPGVLLLRILATLWSGWAASSTVEPESTVPTSCPTRRSTLRSPAQGADEAVQRFQPLDARQVTEQVFGRGTVQRPSQEVLELAPVFGVGQGALVVATRACDLLVVAFAGGRLDDHLGGRRVGMTVF